MSYSAAQTDAPARPGRFASILRRPSSDAVWPYLCLAIVLCLHLHLALTRSANWDEFFYLHLVHSFVRDEAVPPLQTIHVRLFSWLVSDAVLGVDQIVRGRLVMFGAELATCVSIIAIARRFTSDAAAAMCALAYASVGIVMQHAFAFRADPLAIGLSMGALALIMTGSLKWSRVLACAALLGLAFMVTIKLVLLAPVFASAAYLRWSDSGFSRFAAARIVTIPVMALAVAGLLYLAHTQNLTITSGASQMVGNSGNAMFFLGWPEKWVYAAAAIASGIFFFAVLIALAVTVPGSSTCSRAEKIALAGLCCPLALVFCYTNTYPYFYTFMLAPVAAGLAGSMQLFTKRYGIPVVALAFTLNGIVMWAIDGESRLQQQRTIQMAVADMFDEPVNYFDFPGFLPEHRKANFFMTNWGFKNYWQSGVPQMADTMSDEVVPMLAAIGPQNGARFYGLMVSGEDNGVFHPEDVVALRETYRQFWGPIFLAGKELEPDEQTTWNVRVPGSYTVEGHVLVDGTDFDTGDVVELKRGKVMLAETGNASASLTWGNNIAKPSLTPPSRPYWTGF